MMLTDFEINKAVFEIMALNWEVAPTSIQEDPKSNAGVLIGASWGGYCVFDGCNNPSDAWPIIVKNEIDIQFWHGTKCPPMARYCDHYYVDKNPLRAAMIVFLEMRK